MVFAAAVVSRLVVLLAQRPLWVDELMLALSIRSVGLDSLAEPLAYGQVAPPGFAAVLWSVMRLGGGDEWVLRLLPFAAGLVVLLTLVVVGRRFLSAPALLGTLLLAASSPLLRTYSDEMKPYIWDAAACLLIILLAYRVREKPDSRRIALWGALAVLICGTSFPGILATGASVVAVWFVVDRRRRMAVLAVGMAAGALGVWSAVVPRSAGTISYMNRYWADSFPAVDLHLPGRTLGMVGALVGGEGRLGMATAALAGLGLLTLLRRDLWAGLLLAAAPAVAFLLGVAHLYPFAQRTWVFTIPVFLLGAGLGAEWLVRSMVRRDRLAEGVLVTVMALLAVPGAARWTTVVRPKQDGRAAVRYLAAARTSDEPVYVFARALPAWLWYWTDWSNPAEVAEVNRQLSLRRPEARWFHNNPWSPPAGPGARVGEDDPRAGTVLLGAPSGVILTIRERTHPDPRWVQAATARLDSLPARCIWLLATNVPEEAWQAIDSELLDHGWRTVEEGHGRESIARKECRPLPRPTGHPDTN